MSWAKAGKPK